VRGRTAVEKLGEMEEEVVSSDEVVALGRRPSSIAEGSSAD